MSSVVAPAPPLECSVLHVPGNLGVSGEQGDTGTTETCRGLPTNTTGDKVRAPAVSSAAAHRKSSPRVNSATFTRQVPTVMGVPVGGTIVVEDEMKSATRSGTDRVDMTGGTPTIPKTGKRGPRPGPITVVV